MASSREQPIGFGGLDTFVTPIESALAEADRLSQVEPDHTTPEYEESPAEPMHRDWGALGGLGRGLGSLAGIGLSIVVVVALKACASAALSSGGSSSTDYSTSSSPSYSAEPEEPAESTEAPQFSDSGDSSPTDATSDDPTATTDEADPIDDTSTGESAPSPAQLGGRYNAAEVRYCLSEEARVNGAENYMNELKAMDPSGFDLRVDRFNSMVSDWNSRCSRFSYATGTMASIQSAVEMQRQALESEGRGRLE